MTNDNNGNDKYKDIINLPYKKSTKRLHMSNYDRAAQFSPFSALVGHDLAIMETARITDEKIYLDIYQQDVINEKIKIISDNIKLTPLISVTHFVKDKLKSGGEYLSRTDNIKFIDEYEKCLVFTDNSKIYIDDIIEITGKIIDDNYSFE